MHLRVLWEFLEHTDIPLLFWCSNSHYGDVFPCNYGTAAIFEQYGSANLINTVSFRNLTDMLKAQNDSIDYNLPMQIYIENFLATAKLHVTYGAGFNIPDSLPPPMARPVTHTGIIRKALYQCGP